VNILASEFRLYLAALLTGADNTSESRVKHSTANLSICTLQNAERIQRHSCRMEPVRVGKNHDLKKSKKSDFLI